MTTYDLIIIGGGPAGMTAALYAARRRINFALLTADIGGQLLTTPDVENYPGIDFTTGPELARKMYEQIKKAGAEVIPHVHITGIAKNTNGYVIGSSKGEYRARTLILAFGRTPKKLEVVGEDKEGIVNAVVNLEEYRDKEVAIVGGGNSAIDVAQVLVDVVKRVYIIHRRDSLRGEPVEVEKVMGDDRIEKIWDSVVTEVLGDTSVAGVCIANTKTNETRKITCDAVVVAIGFESKTDFIRNLVEVDKKGQVVVDAYMRSSDPNIFVVGDLVPLPYKQISISSGQGTIAALTVYDDLQREKGEAVGGVDWGKQ